MKKIIVQIEKFYSRYLIITQELSHLFLLIIRLYFGYRFIKTGLGKFQNFESVSSYFASLAIPFPEINVMIAASTELFGGILLMTGLASRLISLPLTFTMLIAYLTAHSKSLLNFLSEPSPFFRQEPFPFLFTVLVILSFGAGKYSLDNLCVKFLSSKKLRVDSYYHST